MKTDNHPLYWGAPDALAPVRSQIQREFSRLSSQQPRLFQLALNEAEAAAWQTGFPELLFPALAREKARALAQWHARQQSLRQGDAVLAFAA
jgi:hypothetical protein